MSKQLMKQVKWIGDPPDKCDICERPIEDKFGSVFVDGRTMQGPWACMCRPCHVRHGMGLGTGRGQKFVKSYNGWIKTQG